METTTNTTTAPRTYNRDRLGRFVKVVCVDQLTAEGTFVNDSAGDTHAHGRCGNLKGRTFEAATAATGWLCTACVSVPTPTWLAGRNVAPVSGTQTCTCCNTTRGMRSFPTFVDSGFRMRGTTCRKCEAARRTPRTMRTFPEAEAAA